MPCTIKYGEKESDLKVRNFSNLSCDMAYNYDGLWKKLHTHTFKWAMPYSDVLTNKLPKVCNSVK
jgi:hypothetical protein